jgi:uncharacterized protein YecT (DUF1311 family)
VILSLMLAAGAVPRCATTLIQSEMNDCALSAFQKDDAILNRQWAQTLAAMQKLDRDEGGRENEGRLRKAQRAWLAYRDAHCWSAYPWKSGVELNHMNEIMCRSDLTVDRTQQLKDLEQGN